MKNLSLQEYLKKEDAYFKKHAEYTNKLCTINKMEHDFIESLEGKDFNEKSDIYFDSKKYDFKIKYFETQRKQLKKKYKGYTSQFEDSNFCTTLNQDYIDYLKKEKISDTNATHILKEVQENKDVLFKKYDGTPYKINRAIVAIDDYYYEMINDKGDIYYESCVGFPEKFE